MNIDIDEKKVNELVEKRINELVDKDFGEYISDMVEKRLSTIAQRMTEPSKGHIDFMERKVERIIRQEVKSRLDTMNFFTEEKITALSKDIALSLSSKISCDIIEIVSGCLAPVEEEDCD